MIMLPAKDELEIYIHIPFCKSKCKYCDFVSAPGSDEDADRFVHALLKEIKAQKGKYSDRRITSIFFGGGTPSILSVENFTKIVEALTDSFDLKRQYKDRGPFSLDGRSSKNILGYYLANEKRGLKDQVEFTIECNPDTVDPQKFKAYKKLGVNRISFGLQSNNDKDLKLLGRTYDVDDFTNAYFMAKDAGFENINIDLIHSIPGQNELEFMKSLYGVMMLGPSHISIYSLMVEDGTPFAANTKDISEGGRIYVDEDGFNIPYPSEEEDRKMYHSASGFLKSAGLLRYEISNFAKPGMECRHNKGYWQRRNYIGFGLSAASMVDNVRWKNTADMDRYLDICLSDESDDEKTDRFDGLKEDVQKLSVEDQMSEFIFLGLRMSQGIAKEEFMEEFGVDFDYKYGDVTKKFIDEGLMEIKEFEFYDPEKKTDYIKTRVFLTDKGIDLSNTVMAEYML